MGTKIQPDGNGLSLLVATRKGGFLLHSDPGRSQWRLQGPIFLGAVVNHMVQDPRNPSSLMMAAHTGHLGPTIYHSHDRGNTWQEAKRPPAFPKASEGETGEAVRFTFWLSPGHAAEPGVWYAGTSPAALFCSQDDGDTWEGVRGFNQNPMRRIWLGPAENEPPGGETLHSVQIDPRDPAHIYFGVSTGGVFESCDRGDTWQPLNQGCVSYFLPEPDSEYGHDPHALRIHPLNPDILYQQNHVGIFRMDRKAGRWAHIGENMPQAVGDIGFVMVLHPRDAQTCWVFPMDGTDIWPRTSPSGKPSVYKTTDGGLNWQRQDSGLPQEHAYFTVKRQAMVSDQRRPVGLYFGTTGGQVWASQDEGQHWVKLVDHLPEILALEAVEFSA